MADVNFVPGIKVISYCYDPMGLLGRNIKVYPKNRVNDKAAFFFKVTGSGQGWLDGFDEERCNLRIFIEDIDFILGGYFK